MDFSVITCLTAVLAGAVAAVSGFGIGSLLTPLLSLQIGTKLAVAAVSVPHFFGTALRCWMLRKNINRPVLLSFGLTSAAGGLAGALIHTQLRNPALTVVFGVILVFAGGLGLTGLNERLRFGGWMSWVAGAISGGLGGLVGNQGGIRSAAMLGFNLDKQAFVATATAIGLLVDCARMPVYLYFEHAYLADISRLLVIATAGVVAGTLAGTFLLKSIDERIFKRVISGLILGLGIWMLLAKS